MSYIVKNVYFKFSKPSNDSVSRSQNGREAIVKSSLFATLMFTAISWPVWTCAQPASDAMAKTVKPDEMGVVGGRFRDFDSLHESNDPGDVS